MFDPPYSPETWLPYLELLLELFKGVAWPAALVFVACIYRGELSHLLPRLRKVGPTGAEFDAANQPQAPENSFSSTGLNIEDFELTDPIAKQIEESHIKTLAELPEDRKLKVLIRALTKTQMEKNFMSAYANIFGSQIRALDILNSRPVALTEAHELFREIAERDAVLNEIGFERYMGFLIHWQFVEIRSEMYEITETGRSFLSFVTQVGLPKERLH